MAGDQQQEYSGRLKKAATWANHAGTLTMQLYLAATITSALKRSSE
jgi:hypothetical protein